MQKFGSIYLDIVGYCNAKCPYCLSGRYGNKEKKLISSELFNDVLQKIADYKLCNRSCIIGLYNWGEPFLHPRLTELMKIANNYPFKYSFSTNASIVPNINSQFVKKLDHIMFSMPGFSQKSYDKIHGFDFKKILTNIKAIIRSCRDYGFRGHFIIVYHIYRFNQEEFNYCEEFADKLGVILKPNYAILNNWSHINQWLDNTLPHEMRREIMQNLFINNIDQTIRNAPEKYSCPQYNILVVNEKADITICCQTPKNDDYVCGNLLKDDFHEIILKRMHNSVCKKCIDSGLAYYWNNALTLPIFFNQSTWQKLKKAKLLIDRYVKTPQLFLKNMLR